jgi:uncharacterized protein YdeI (YjbR/CyaY-like superfamily)
MTAILTDETMMRAQSGVPPDLGAALAANPAAAAAFDRLTYAARRECIDWIEAAGWTQLRRGRIKRVLARIAVPSRI